jgi:branched-chain amino acid transport system substrate-binding protein
MLRLILRTMPALFLTVIVTGQAAGDAGDTRPMASLAARGKRLMHEGAWLEASRTFGQLISAYPDSRDIDAYVFNHAKAEYYLGSYGEAIADFEQFTTRFPASASIAHARFFLGNAYYQQGDVSRAVRSYIDAYAVSADPRLTELLETSISTAIVNAPSVRLGKADFEELAESKRCALVKSVVDALLDKNRMTPARQLAGFCSQKLDFGGRLEYTPGKTKDRFEVAMVLPFSGEMHTFGEEIQEGAVVAADLCRRRMGLDMRLTTYDTRGDPIDAARIIGELAGSNADLAIGPLTSDEAAVAAAVLACKDLPLLIPAATDAGLTALSSTTFQLSPNIELQGLVMADYAIRRLKADSAVIITSTHPDHLRMAQAFADRFKERGGTIVATEYYRTRDKDFGPYLLDIKGIILRTQADSTNYENENGDTVRFDAVPVAMDCFFLPGSSDQLRLLLEQMNFYGISGAYLGTDGWGERDVFRLGDDITRGAVFPSPFLTGARCTDYAEFAAAFEKRYGCRPQRLSNLGYDAVKLAAAAITAGGVTRESFADKLRKITGYVGASGAISFGAHRENIELPLYRIENNQAVLITGLGSTSYSEDDPVDGN